MILAFGFTVDNNVLVLLGVAIPNLLGAIGTFIVVLSTRKDVKSNGTQISAIQDKVDGQHDMMVKTADAATATILDLSKQVAQNKGEEK